MRVLIPGPLRSYTSESSVVAASGESLAAIVDELDQRYPGIRFRIIDEQGAIRRHIKFFVNGVQAMNLQPRLQDDDEVMIVCALSGG
ncbi:MAG: MoaD/ThiS family protein [Betaproteobacteria bacterium]|nr:MAG: MoaD/ThiS family protein [Betaproteobacteria bacterium]